MQLGMIGLGRMGANMVRRLVASGQECVVFDMSPKAVGELAREGAVGASSIADFAKRLAEAEDKKEALEDLFWALLNTNEFLFNR